MTAGNRKTYKVAAALCIYIVFGTVSISIAAALPTAQDIAALARQGLLVAETFMQQSVEQRLGFQCCPQSISEADRAKLYALAAGASEQLATIISSQELFKKQIEDYNGDDWDRLYGTTGLWHKLCADLHRSRLLKCEIDYHFAVAAPAEEKTKILGEVITQINTFPVSSRSRAIQILKAYALAALGGDNPAYRHSASPLLDAILDASESDDEIYFSAAVAKMKLGQDDMPQALLKLSRRLEQSGCRNNFELNFSIAFLQRQYGSAGAVERLVRKWPSCRDFLGRLILADLSHRLTAGQLSRQQIESISVFEAKCAAQAACRAGPEKYTRLLQKLIAVEKLQTPLLFYTTAVAHIERSPATAVQFLLKAARAGSKQKVSVLGLGPKQIAASAAELAYNLFAENANYCNLAVEALQDYFALAGDGVDEQLEYSYSIVLRHLGREDKAGKLLAGIAARPDGKFAHQAKYDILVDQIEKQQPAEGYARAKLLRRLSDLAAVTAGAEPQLRNDVTLLYCQMLLAESDKACAEKVLDVLTGAEDLPRPRSALLKARAMQKLGKSEQVLAALASALDSKSCENATLALELLQQIIDKVDEYRAEAQDFDRLLGDGCVVAEYLRGCATGGDAARAGLILAELGIFAAKKEKHKLAAIERALQELSAALEAPDVDLLRCRARLFAAQGRFAQAAELWAQVCKIHRGRVSPAGQPGPKWWRAKFYELACWAKRPGTSAANVLHTIEVLQKSFSPVPTYWAERLALLKKQLAAAR